MKTILLLLILAVGRAASADTAGFGLVGSKDFVGSTGYVLLSDHWGVGFDYKFGLDTFAVKNGGSAIPGAATFTRWDMIDVGSVYVAHLESFDLVQGAYVGQATKYTLAKGTEGLRDASARERMVNVSVSLAAALHMGAFLGVSYDTAPGAVGAIIGWHW
jgi:hypothetical protein